MLKLKKKDGEAMDLNERKRRILKSVVDTYIMSGEPVGSKYLSGSMGLDISSATIRNEMSELEQLGFLEQPHASAGRVPSSMGYRMYVENLMNQYSLSLEEINVLNDVMNSRIRHLSDIVSELTRVLSDMTDYTAFAYTAKPKASTIVRFEGVLLSPKSFLLVMITSQENVKTHQIRTDITLTAEVLSVIIKLLNENLTGVNIEQISLESIYDLEDKFGVYRGVLSDILRNIVDTVKGEYDKQVYLDGMSNILKYPDFADISKTQSLISLLEDKENLIRMITDPSVGHEGLNVLIGDGMSDRGLDKTSCIYHKFSIGNGMTGVLGLIGPKRMDYSGVIAKLEYVVNNLIGDERN